MSRSRPFQTVRGVCDVTIFALASGRGRSGVAVVRISGPEAGHALTRLTGQALPKPRRAHLFKLYHPITQDVLDHALVLWFRAPASFTGEDVVELHIHGGPAVVEGILQVLGSLDGLRLAEPGEFTRRAFENGKLDLTQVEGLADLIEAETEAQRRQALRQSEGELGALYDGWRHRLIKVLAYFEAELDFSDEDLPADIQNTIWQEVQTLLMNIRHHVDDGRHGERLRDGVRLAIIGPPNAGKSSLINLLAQRDAAIVSDMAGTTRDVVEVHLNLGGYAVMVADTAGLRDTDHCVEQEGVRRAEQWAAQADIKLAVFDGAQYPICDDYTRRLLDDQTVVVINKIDVMLEKGTPVPDYIDEYPVLGLSVKTGRGIDDLLNQLKVKVEACCDTGTEGPAPTRARHRLALHKTEGALSRFLEAKNDVERHTELKAEDLRLAVRELGRITGRVNVEDLLDVIFKDFCIGK